MGIVSWSPSFSDWGSDNLWITALSSMSMKSWNYYEEIFETLKKKHPIIIELIFSFLKLYSEEHEEVIQAANNVTDVIKKMDIQMQIQTLITYLQ